MPSARDAARQIIDHLPEHATWDDIMYELYIEQKIGQGLADIEQAARSHTMRSRPSCWALVIESSRRARTDIRNRKAYIAKDSPYYARRFTKRIIASVEKVEGFSQIGRSVPEAEGRDDARKPIHQG